MIIVSLLITGEVQNQAAGKAVPTPPTPHFFHLIIYGLMPNLQAPQAHWRGYASCISTEH